MAKILIGITGSIAAYKIIELCHLLKKSDHQVKIILTKDAQNFVTPVSLASFDTEVFSDSGYNENNVLQHINLSRFADLIIISPLSANTLAKIAGGLADNLLTATVLASTCPVYLVPAMNVHMWQNKITKYNVRKLKDFGYNFWGPDTGLQACGDNGEGRMIEASEIMANITHTLLCKEQLFKGKKIVITAGSTRESIDPVRYLSNHSSGKMGYALARAFASHGANVYLISGITNLAIPNTITQFIPVTTSNQMFEKSMANIDDADIFIGCAAVSDYKVENYTDNKIKKQDKLTLTLVKNPDIIATVKQQKPELFVVGFAAETNNLIEYAIAKIKNKNLDLIVANDVSNSQVFGSENNEVTIIDKSLNKTKLVEANKNIIAHQIIQNIRISTNYPN
jgi:phosphopantothenoylcysteine decarboxylase/phosphopantothenate--cysteine ligase